jgi:hypothetical protein
MGSPKTIMDVQTTTALDQLATKSRNLKTTVFEYWFAARVGLWLCWLPIALRIHSLPALLQRLRPAHDESQKRNSIKLERAVEIVARVCRMRLFELRLFPRACLRQSLALYHVLPRMGYPVEIHLGVEKKSGKFFAHSWVTLEGKRVADRTRPGVFKVLYSYPRKSILDLKKNGGDHEKQKRCAAAG